MPSSAVSETRDILILNYEYPPIGGGAGEVSRRYAEGLAALGHRVTVVTTWYPGESEFSAEWSLTIVRLRSRRAKAYQSNPLEMLSWAWHARGFLAGYCREHPFDLSIAFFSLPGGIVARSLQAWFGIPYILSTHGADIPGFFPERMAKYHRLTEWYIRRVFREAAHVLALTSEMRDLMLSFEPAIRDRVTILPNGGDTAFFSPDPAVGRRDRFTVLFSGRLCEEKDPMVFLRALRILRDRGVDTLARIAGDGPMREQMESYVREHGLSERVAFLGWLDRANLRDEYRRAHVVASCSRVEAMSVGILESLLCGPYVVVTPVSGNVEMISPGINGEFFHIGDAEALAGAIERVARSPESYSSDRPEARAQAECLRGRYDWSAIVRELAIIVAAIP